MGVTGGDVPEHDHIVDTGKSSFGLDELGHIQPGLARIMPEIGARIWKCYYAGKAGNQPLARFQLKEAVNLMEMGAFVRPKYEENMTKFLAEDVEQVKQAIEAKDWDKFETRVPRHDRSGELVPRPSTTSHGLGTRSPMIRRPTST